MLSEIADEWQHGARMPCSAGCIVVRLSSLRYDLVRPKHIVTPLTSVREHGHLLIIPGWTQCSVSNASYLMVTPANQPLTCIHTDPSQLCEL
jgi:hypothetical protein